MPDNNTSDYSETYDVVVTRVLDAPVEEVWKAWSDPAYVMRWWGPTGFTSPSAEMDFRVGGASLVCMRAPAEYGGQDFYNTWTYTTIDPHERIEFVSNFADEDGTHIDRAAMGMPPGVPFDVPHVITFEAAGEGRTEMTVTEHGYTTEQARDLSRAGMEQCLDKMAAIFARYPAEPYRRSPALLVRSGDRKAGARHAGEPELLVSDVRTFFRGFR
jgi:uncharacterized protein YndB with AHSA1/START domain